MYAHLSYIIVIVIIIIILSFFKQNNNLIIQSNNAYILYKYHNRNILYNIILYSNIFIILLFSCIK